MDRFIDGVVATADHVGRQAAQHEADQPLLRRVERLVPERGSPASTSLETGRRRRALIEDDYTVTDAVVVGSLLSRCCGTPTG